MVSNGSEGHMAMFAFLLLIAALVLFLVSTKQWPLWMRGVAWAVGAGLLVFAAVSAGGAPRDPELGAALGDYFAKITHPSDSMLARMFASNGASIERIVTSLFDIFLVLAAL